VGTLKNNSTHAVSNIRVVNCTIKCNGNVIAKKDFDILKDDTKNAPLTLPAGESREYTFVFYENEYMQSIDSLNGEITCTFDYSTQ